MEFTRIRLDNLLPKVFAGEKRLDSDVWLREVCLEKNTRYLIRAASGTGKSSLCSFLYGSRDDYSGQIFFGSADVRRFGVSRWSAVRQRNLSLLPQEMRLFPELTVMENIEIKNRLTGFRSRGNIQSLLDRVGIGDKAAASVRRLSIGQQQRVAIIRALCQPFDFLILDEPVSHLDESNNRVVSELIDEELTVRGAGAIVTSVGNDLCIQYDHTLKL